MSSMCTSPTKLLLSRRSLKMLNHSVAAALVSHGHKWIIYGVFGCYDSNTVPAHVISVFWWPRTGHALKLTGWLHQLAEPKSWQCLFCMGNELEMHINFIFKQILMRWTLILRYGLEKVCHRFAICSVIFCSATLSIHSLHTSTRHLLNKMQFCCERGEWQLVKRHCCLNVAHEKRHYWSISRSIYRCKHNKLTLFEKNTCLNAHKSRWNMQMTRIPLNSVGINMNWPMHLRNSRTNTLAFVHVEVRNHWEWRSSETWHRYLWRWTNCATTHVLRSNIRYIFSL